MDVQMSDKYKTQIEDFRNLKPYYDLVFENMTSITKFSFSRDFQKLTDSMRELIANAPSYIIIEWSSKDPEDEKKLIIKHYDADEILDLIEDEYAKLFDKKFMINGRYKDLNRDDQMELDQIKDDYLKFSRKLRIKIGQSMMKTGFLPKMDKIRIKEQSDNTKGASL